MGNDYMNENAEFLRQISGALHQCINDLGPIDRASVGHAARKIDRSIYAFVKSNKLNEMSDDQILKEKNKEIMRLSRKIQTFRKVVGDLLQKLEDTGTFKRTGKNRMKGGANGCS